MIVRTVNFGICCLALVLLTIVSISTVYAQQKDIEILPGMVMPTDISLQNIGCVQIKSYPVDKFPQVPGPETTVTLYRCINSQFALYRFDNLQIYAVAVKTQNNTIEACIDEDSLGYCTNVVQEDEEFTIDFAAYDIKTKHFDAYGVEVLNQPQPEGLHMPMQPVDFFEEDE